MSERTEVIDLIRQWIEKAEGDLFTAEHLLTVGQQCPFAVVGFHAQQCAEKYIKALLVSLSINFPKIHDIGELTRLLPSGYSMPLEKSQQEQLTDYATVGRYPGWEPVTQAGAEEAVVLARNVREAVRHHLPGETLGGIAS
jgi:HEPN domain-containing protein